MLGRGSNRNCSDMSPFSQTQIAHMPWTSLSQNQKTSPEEGKGTFQSILLFLKTLQEDLIKSCLGPRGHFLWECFSLSLPWHQERGKKKNNNWHSFCAQSFKSAFTHSKKDAKRNSSLNSLIPCWHTYPPTQAQWKWDHRCKHWHSQRHWIRELILS